tara:strand:- start:599 stop:1360 length:762 start_codon:yes stop_codon:yes gene_type:complete
MALPNLPWLKDVNGRYVHPKLEPIRNAPISAVIGQFNTGFAKPNLFEVDITRVGVKKENQAKFRMGCFQAQLPGTNIATTDPRDIAFRSSAYQKIYSDVILGFYCSGDLKELNFFQDWMNDIVDPVTNHIGYYRNYISSVKIKQLGQKDFDANKFETNPKERIVATWTLHEAYPKTIDPVQLDYGTTDTVMVMNVSMTYQHVTHEWHKNPKAIDYSDSFKKIEERAEWPFKDESGAAIPNPKTGNWSNARQNF